jgi:hypothetical protein
MTMSTRSRLSLLLAVAALLVAGILGAQTVGAGSRATDGSEPGSGGGDDGVSGICVAPSGPDDGREGPPPSAEDGAQLVEPTPGMADVRPHIFDHVVANEDGTSITVFFWSGVEPCYVLDHVDVDQGPSTISVTLFEGHDASAGDVACIEIALLKKVVVQLDAPVGDRRIVDGAA